MDIKNNEKKKHTIKNDDNLIKKRATPNIIDIIIIKGDNIHIPINTNNIKINNIDNISLNIFILMMQFYNNIRFFVVFVSSHVSYPDYL